MNTNQEVKRVLCFGDSITRGRIPSIKKRFSPSERWTGIMQNILGSDYEVIEEGLRGRTTDLQDSSLKGKNGLEYFFPCIYSHLPVEIVIIFLGTNNLQSQFDQSIEEIANSFDEYVQIISFACDDYELDHPKIILVSPSYIDATCLKHNTIFSEQAGIQSHGFSQIYKQKSQELGLHFFDAATIVGSGRGDGVHLDLEQNNMLGKALAAYIKTL